MSDTPKETQAKPAKAARQQHVVAHRWRGGEASVYDEILVFGTELEALRHIVGKHDWEYKALAHGQAFGAQP